MSPSASPFQSNPLPSTRLILVGALAAVLLVSLLACTRARAEELGNPWCPVKPDEKSLSQFKTEHEGKTVHFCCKGCIKTFEEAPASYLAPLPQFASEQRPAWRRPIDHLWNTAARFPGLALGLVTVAGIGLARAFVSIAGISGWLRRIATSAGSAKGLASVALLAVGTEALSAHFLRIDSEKALAGKELEDLLHFATFTDYGDPPIPSPPSHSNRLEVTYYRGNDERNDLLYNGGFYRTASFDLSLCRADGVALFAGNPAPPADDLFLKFRITRAPGTPDYFWTPERMDSMFATRESGRFLGRDTPVGDLIPLDTLEPMQRWEIRYPLAAFVTRDDPEQTEGIVYLCEKRFDLGGKQIGSRFHYAFQFALDFRGGKIRDPSSLWMGSLYRSRILRIWEIPEREWLSPDPIPIIEGEHRTEDPEILGISGHEKSED